MSSDWQEMTLADIAEPKGGLVDGPFGSNLPASCYVEKGVPVIRGSNLTVGLERFKSDDFVYVSNETLIRIKRSECLPNDIVFTKKGTLGQTGLVPYDSRYERYLLSSNQMRLRVNTDLADPEYVYYYVSSKASVEKIKRDSEFTGVPKINLDYLKKFPIVIPKLIVQKKISKILSGFDHKIELNNQINQTLEAMAQAIFKSWFVDFEPVKAKIAAVESGEDTEGITRVAMNAISGKTEEELDQLQDEQPEHYTQLKTTAELFPSTIQDSDFGLIPKGWRVGYLGELASILSGKRPNQRSDCKNEEFNVPLIGASSIMGYVNEVLYKEPILVIGRVGTHGIIQRIFQPSYPSDNTLVIRTKYDEYVYQTLNSIDYGSLNVGSTQPLITQTSIKHNKIVIPDESLLDRFERISACMFSKINSNNIENQNLCDLRDFLLPKLISGELSVNSVEFAEADA